MATESIPLKTGRKRKRTEGTRWQAILEKSLGSTGTAAREHFFASQVGLCARQGPGMIYLPDTYESYRDATFEFYVAAGNAFERVVEKGLKRANVFINAETKIKLSLNEADAALPVISGRVDFLVRDKKFDGTGEIRPVELKSCGALPPSPKAAHLAQLKTYLVLCGIDKGLLWYISRNVADWSSAARKEGKAGRLNHKVFEVNMDRDDIADTLLTLATASVHAKYSYLPPIPSHMKKYKCGFCPLQPKCWDGESMDLIYKKTPAKMVPSLAVETAALRKSFMAERPDLKGQFIELAELWAEDWEAEERGKRSIDGD